MEYIKRLVTQFRDAIEKAKDEGAFLKDARFCQFPIGCCDDASDLLAQFLLENGIRTRTVYNTYRDRSDENKQSHTWLLINNNIIIDITGDQFKNDPVFLYYNNPVYIGAKDDFHRRFKFDDGYENNGIDALGDGCQLRLNKLYQTITERIRNVSRF